MVDGRRLDDMSADIDEAAARWHLAQADDDMDWSAFTEWLEADPRHRDAYDAMAGRRPYQGSLAESTIRENLAAAGGGHLDQSIVAVFLDKLSYYRERIYASA